jgi:hypothetical protein
VTFNKLNQHFQANNVLAPEQFGFWKGTGWLLEKQFFTLTDNILTVLNQQQQVEVIFYNLAKAFDCVNHEIF